MRVCVPLLRVMQFLLLPPFPSTSLGSTIHLFPYCSHSLPPLPLLSSSFGLHKGASAVCCFFAEREREREREKTSRAEECSHSEFLAHLFLGREMGDGCRETRAKAPTRPILSPAFSRLKHGKRKKKKKKRKIKKKKRATIYQGLLLRF